MNVLRFLGRTLLGSYFIGHGVRNWRAPQEAVAEAEPVLDRVQTLTQRWLPESVRRFVPTDARTFVRLHAGVEIVGGLLMASGVARRLGAAALVKGQILRAAAGNPPNASGRGPISPELGRDLALLGACLIEALDTQGKPSLAWHLSQGRLPRAGRDGAAARDGKASRRAADRAAKATHAAAEDRH